MTGSTMTDSVEQSLYTAAKYIADRCDWAESEDGVGYSKADASFGHGLAETPLPWPEDVLPAAYKILRKYRRQLTGVVDFDEIDEPISDGQGGYYSHEAIKSVGRTVLRERALAASKKILKSDDGAVEVHFKYNAALVAAVRGLPGRRFDPAKKIWTAPMSAEVAAFAAANDFKIDPDLLEELSALVTPDAKTPEITPSINDAPVYVGKASSRDGSIVFSINISVKGGYERKDYIKRELRGRYQGAPTHEWVAPKTHASEAIAYAKSEGFEIDPSILDMKVSVAEETEEASRASDADIVMPADFGGGDLELFPFQRAGVAYSLAALQTGRGTMIADEMGLGKTPMGLGVARMIGYPAVFVVPASLKGNWKNEAERWLPGRKAVILSGRKSTPAAIKGADIIIVNYEILGSWIGEIKKVKPKIAIFDEAHYLKTPGAQRTKAAIELAKAAGKTVLLTGTPVMNRPVEFVSLLKVMDRIDDFGGEWTFKQNYCGAFHNGFGWDFSGATNLKELNTFLRRSCFIRRLKKAVQTELPPKMFSTIPLTMTNEKIYRKAEKDFTGYLADKGEDAPDVEHLAKLGELRKIVADGKIAPAIEWIKDHLADGEGKLVVFAHHISTQQALYTAFKDESVWIKGGDPDGNTKAVEAFQNDDSIRVCVASIKAGGVGHTLTASSEVAFVELDWTPSGMQQAEDRVHRIGQESETVNVYWLIAEDTIDTDMAEMLASKRLVTNAAHGDDSPKAVQASSQRIVMEKMVRRLNS